MIIADSEHALLIQAYVRREFLDITEDVLYLLVTRLAVFSFFDVMLG